MDNHIDAAFQAHHPQALTQPGDGVAFLVSNVDRIRVSMSGGDSLLSGFVIAAAAPDNPDLR